MTRFISLASLLLVATLSACGRQDAVPDQKTATTVPLQSAVAGAVVTGEKVSFTTSDGIVIVGTLYAASKPSPAILCLHEWRKDRSVFNDLAASLHAAGCTVLAIDMRGYGESTKRKDGSRVEPDRVAAADVDAALTFLKTQKSVDAKHLGILGASYGSSNALIYAADHAEIKALVLLSPGLNYFSVLPTEPAMRTYAGRPMLAIAGTEDMRSVEAVEKYATIASSGLVTKLYDNGGHGVELTHTHPECGALIIEFFRKNL